MPQAGAHPADVPLRALRGQERTCAIQQRAGRHPGQPSGRRIARAAAGSVLLLVGPAGGFEPAEVDRLQAAGFRAASLGPRILRAETAALAAVAITQASCGDLS